MRRKERKRKLLTQEKEFKALTLNLILVPEGRGLWQSAGQLIGINKTNDDLVMLFPLAGPGASYCSWDLEGLNRYGGLFYGTKDRTSGNRGGVLSLREWRTESNLQSHSSAPEPNWPFSLAAKILATKNPALCNSCCNCKKLHLLHLLSFRKDADN